MNEPSASESMPRTTDHANGEQQNWEQPIASLLSDLSSVQADLLKLLNEKRGLLAKGETTRLAAIQPKEQELVSRLADCQSRRQSLLADAESQGLPHKDIQTLTATLPAAERQRLQPGVAEARHRSRLLQHQSLTNWVLAQRTMLHLSQMIEIIATGGKAQPTYGEGNQSRVGGSLVDQAV